MPHGNALMDLAQAVHSARDEDLERRAVIHAARPRTNNATQLRSRMGTILVRLGERLLSGNQRPVASAGADKPC